ncbi:N-acetylmuramoyl-L-alanine amidase family protein [Geotoga petraea]|jgi:N-acetylmuramoyl-L-alanine amidase|uniref:N-acetylmuramoyl-L-alanine amidase n=1 Tax=Geotoga petraea TaxID=28234 RepID=A0A1G6MW53_9BACT|nr:N-acetylmuramoyl-L-alanine amidase [Geotoga petraea]MDK2946348.1 N-acetylmuramoyl-L-alanine amidase [Geotoga sp.]TGG87327.1 N-acetylmuramoyl-L-alanine amidase [Geotoga petraea]SDC59474.1 N-acetylmuramoyl-L-alanine amidase [Geotoga petraea]
MKLKKNILIILMLLSVITLFSQNVFFQWRSLDEDYYVEKDGKYYYDLEMMTHKANKNLTVNNDTLYYISNGKWKVFIFPKNNMMIINSQESYSFSEEDKHYIDGKLYLSAEIIAKALNLELINSSAGIFFNIPLARVDSINTYIKKESARTIIEFSSEVNPKIYPLTNETGYLVIVENAQIPGNFIEKEYNNKIEYITAYHQTSTIVWIKIKINVKHSVKKTFEPSRLILDFAFEESEFPVVVLDPGHGGWEPGAVGLGKTLEKDLTLKVAKRAKEMLANYSIETYLTRDSDQYIDLHGRAKFSNDKNADLFISIHLNSFPTYPSTRGSELYYFDFSKSTYARMIAWKENLDFNKDKDLLESWTNIKETSISDSFDFAEILEKHIENKGFKNRRIEPAEFAVLRYTRSPAILFELDFLSNEAVEKKFNDGDYVEDFAEIIKDAVIEYFDIK